MTTVTQHRGSADFLGADVRWSVQSEDLPAPVLNGIHEEVAAFFAGYRPPATTTPFFLCVEDYVELGHAIQCFGLAHDAEEASPSEVHRYLDQMRSSLEVLEKADPRYTYAHSLSRAAATYAGELDVESAMDVWNELSFALPAPLTEPQDEGPYIVVDDLQPNEAFAHTLLPTRGDLRISAVEDLDAEEFNEPRRLVFAHGQFEPPSFLVMDRLLKGGDLSMTVQIDEDTADLDLAHLALRDLRRRLDAHFAHSQEIELTQAEYYSRLALAHSCCALLRFNQQARTDLRYRLGLLKELDESLHAARKRNPDLKHAWTLAGMAKAACERMDLGASISLAEPIVAWLPEDLRERIPANWDFDTYPGITDELLWGIIGVSNDLVRVFLTPPGKADTVERLDRFPTAEDVEPRECYLFSSLH